MPAAQDQRLAAWSAAFLPGVDASNPLMERLNRTIAGHWIAQFY